MTQIGRSSRHFSVTVPGGGRVRLAWAALTDIGHRRAVNEDSLLARSPIFSVADGMGGHAAGDVASRVVVTRLAELVSADFVGENQINRALGAAVDDMMRVVEHTDEGTGTTVTGVALTLRDGVPAWLVFNIGDSRVYQLIDGELRQLTIDHSVVQELVDAGTITRAEADVHPYGNVITRAVGFNEEPVPDYLVIPVVVGARILVCSDGLTKELTERGISHFLSGGTPREAARELVGAALENGGRDNVTVVVVDALATG